MYWGESGGGGCDPPLGLYILIDRAGTLLIIKQMFIDYNS